MVTSITRGPLGDADPEAKAAGQGSLGYSGVVWEVEQYRGMQGPLERAAQHHAGCRSCPQSGQRWQKVTGEVGGEGQPASPPSLS